MQINKYSTGKSSNIGQPFSISGRHLTKLYITNNILELVTVQKAVTSPPPCRRVSKTHYVDLQTGEVLEYKKKMARSANGSGIIKSCMALRRIVNNNFVGDDSELHICLTYATDMRDYEKACIDSRRFLKIFRYHYPSEYIRIIEPQGNGRWHIHLLIKKMGGQLSVNYEHVRALWGMGNVNVSRLPFADNYGAYFSARLTDIDALEESELQQWHPAAKKQISKGSRLKFYPPHFKLYTTSRGIMKPQPLKMSYAEAQKIIGDALLVYTYTKKIVREDDGKSVEVNRIFYEQYNKKY